MFIVRGMSEIDSASFACGTTERALDKVLELLGRRFQDISVTDRKGRKHGRRVSARLPTTTPFDRGKHRPEPAYARRTGIVGDPSCSRRFAAIGDLGACAISALPLLLVPSGDHPGLARSHIQDPARSRLARPPSAASR
jgi:hypothetical protein